MIEPGALEKVASSLPVKGVANAVGILGSTVVPY